MNTSELFGAIGETDFNTNPVLAIDNVVFDPDELIELLTTSDTWQPLMSSDGFVSHIFEDPQADLMDHSHTNQYFGLHTDGQYLAEVPQLCILYCVDAGTGDIPTVFADSRTFVRTLREKGLYDKAKQFDFIYTKKEGAEFRRPLIETNPATGEEVMCVVTTSPPIRLVPSKDSIATQSEADEFFEKLSDLAILTLPLTPHYWRAGQVVVFDNASLIHGRGLTEKVEDVGDKSRHLIRIWLEKVI